MKLRHEVYRKIMHFIACFTIAHIVYLPNYFASLALIITAAIISLIDLVRIFLPHRSKISWMLGRLHLNKLFRAHEHHHLTGLTYIMISALICFFLFPLRIFLLAFMTLATADSCAGLVGLRYGRHKIGDKSLEGSLTFFFISITVVILYMIFWNQGIDFLMSGIAASSIVTMIELKTKNIRLDDNLSIPLVYSSVFTLVLEKFDSPFISCFFSF